RHLGSAQAAAAADLDALRARAHRRAQRSLHRAPERDTALELLGYRLRDQPGLQLGALDLGDVDLHGLAGHVVQLLAERVHLGAGLADHDARPGGVDVDRDLLLVLADVDVRQAGMRELAVDVVTDLEVLGEIAREVLAGREPVRLPGVDEAAAQGAGMNLVAHYESASLLSSSVSVSDGSSVAGSGSGSASGSGSG